MKRPFPFPQPLCHNVMMWRGATGIGCPSSGLPSHLPWSCPCGRGLGHESGDSQPREGTTAQEGGCTGVKHAPILSQHPTLGTPRHPGRTKRYPGSGILPGDTMAPFPSCSTRRAGTKSSATGGNKVTTSTQPRARPAQPFCGEFSKEQLARTLSLIDKSMKIN